MGNVTTIGLDLAKSVFQVHGVDDGGVAVLRQRLTRARLLASANSDLKSDYVAEAAAIVENDTRQRGIYEYLTRKIVERAAATAESDVR